MNQDNVLKVLFVAIATLAASCGHKNAGDFRMATYEIEVKYTTTPKVDTITVNSEWQPFLLSDKNIKGSGDGVVATSVRSMRILSKNIIE